MDLGNLLVHLRADATQYNTVMKGAVAKMNATSAALTSAGRTMMRSVTLPIVAIAAMSVKAFASFEEQLANVSTMLDDHTMKYLPAYAEGMKKMSLEFGEGSRTLSRGLYDILSASIAPAKAMGVLGEAVKAAKAGMTDTAVAADAITTVINSYSMAAEDAGKVSDILFATVKRGKTTFAELAPQIGMVAAIASSAGLSFEEVGAAIATMTRAGLRTRLAVTALRATINAFLKPTDDAIKAVKAFGFALNSTTLSTIGLTGVMEKLKDASAEQLAAIFPNIRALAGVAAMSRQAEKQLDDLKLMFNSTGLTQKAYDKMTQTLIHSLRQMWQGLKVVAISIGTTLEPYIRRASESIQDFSKWWHSLRVEVQKHIIAYGILIAAIGPLLRIMGGLIKLFSWLTAAVLAATSGMYKFAAAVLGALAGPLGLLLLLAAAAYTLRAAWNQNFAKMQEFYKMWLEGLKVGYAWLQDTLIGPFLDWFVRSWRSAFEGVKTFAKWFIKDLASTLAAGWAWIKKIKEGVTDAWMAPDWNQFFSNFKEGFNSANAEFDKVYSAVFAKTDAWINKTFDAIVKTVTEKSKIIADEVKLIVAASLETLGELMSVVKTQFGQDAADIIALIQETMAGLQKIEPAKIEGIAEATNEYKNLYDAAVKAQQIIADTNAESREAVRDRLAALDVEIELMGYLNEARERAQGLMEFRNLLEEAYGDDIETMNRLLGEYITKMERLARGTTGMAAFRKEIELAGMEAINLGKQLGQVVVSSVDRLSSTWTKFIMDGEADFRAMARSIVADLIQMIIKAMLFRAVMSIFGIPTMPDFSGLTGSLGGVAPGGPGSAALAVGVMHKGGRVGQTNFPSMALPASMFANAVRLHKGLRGNEYPAVLERGEQVIPRGGDSEATEPISINITNNITAMDTQDVSRAIAPLSRQMASQVKGAMRKNHPIRR